MNIYLENIKRLLQDAALTENEKQLLLKAVTDADKQWSITDFKLDRTEKVKKTTAILLEETIEELEQKRKAVEAQNRELEIESSLERVRTVAMGMSKPDDMLDVCKTIAEQLALLHVKEIRNVQTAIFYAEKSTYINYEFYVKHQQPLVTEVSYKTHDVQKEFAERMMKGLNEFYSRGFSGKEVQDWYEYQKTTNVFLDSYLEHADSLTYYWFSLGPVALGMSTYKPLQEEQLNLFRRFRNVFELSYRRYLDIEKAAAQAKEAQLESSLERVRAQALGMRTPGDLPDICEVLFTELQTLGFTELRNTMINIFDDDKRSFLNYDYAPHAGKTISNLFYNTHPVIEKQVSQARSAADAFSEAVFAGKDLEEWKAFRKKAGEADDPKVDTIEALYYYFYSIDTGVIGISSYSAITEEKREVLKRFRNVFDFAYRRYIDVAQAEAQAREARIETALERVRAVAMAMRVSDDLLSICEVLFKELSSLGFSDLRNALIVSFGEGKDHFDDYDYADATGGSITYVPYNSHPIVEGFVKRIRCTPGMFSELVVDESELNSWKEYRKRNGQPVDLRLDQCSSLHYYMYSIGISSIGISAFSPLTKDKVEILERFANVFKLAYQRYVDISNAEAQAREAQIQLALERARAQSMMMQHSTELGDTLRVFHQQLQLLDINSAFSFLWLPDEEKEQHIFWAIWEEDKNGITDFKNKAINYLLDRNEPATAQCLIDWKGDEPVVSYAVPPEGVKNYFAAWQELIDGVEKLTPEHFSNGLYYVEAFMKYGCFGVMFENDLTADEKKILGRFAVEFERTYTRFLDLQKAEAQAKEAQIETSLERVRAKTMAMHNSTELAAVVNVLFRELRDLQTADELKIMSRGFITTVNEDAKLFELWITEIDGSEIKQQFVIAFDEPTTGRMIYDAWLNRKPYIISDLSGKELDQWLDYLESLNFKVAPGIRGSRRVNSFIYYSRGFIGVTSSAPLSESNIQLLQRFAKVFEQTYTRFLDLQKAEAQSREAQIEAALERVRSRTLAMQKSDELAETAGVLFQQLITLGMEPNRLYIGIVNGETRDMEMWATDEDGSGVGKKFTFNAADNESVKKLYDGWANKIGSVTVNMQGAELDSYIAYLQKLQIPLSYALTQKRRVQSVAYFDKGFIGMASPDDQSAASINLLERFAAVFNLTFTRFNDLKIAEAHALQAEQDLIAIKEAKQKAEDTLTELQATQKQLIQSEKMASLGELTAGIAHEIQNPLNFVNNFSEVSKELLDEMKEAVEKGDTEEAREIMNDVIQNLEKINHHGKRADAIVKGMLQHSRSSSGQKEAADINALCDEYLRLAYHGLRAKDKSFNAILKTDFDQNIGNIHIIPQDMGRVLLNLITNAFYAVAEKGKASLKDLPSLYEPAVSVSTKKLQDKVEIKVSDNGNGIPQNIIDKIFQPFFTTKPSGQGTGLGLSLAYDIVKAHGGELKVETKEGEGSVFIILLY